MLDFYKTGGGRRFCDSTLPEIGRQLKRFADEMRRANNLKEFELGIRKIGPADVALEFVEGVKGVEGVEGVEGVKGVEGV